jgi:hypothetical protein
VACEVNFLSSKSQNQDNISVYHDTSELIYKIENELFVSTRLLKTIYQMIFRLFFNAVLIKSKLKRILKFVHEKMEY